ncbi:hypothetical protein NLU13_2046 [Sarocladium strictum]|uniref:Mucin n=1 Tax=Sarocladium strictum TaxID=5046 RepID=A0AA39LCB7_SARSR|nr:hypothetical protein NLU13_2046 [Sarocladium strictum]
MAQIASPAPAQAPAQARNGPFWCTAGPMAAPVSACGGTERSGSITASESDCLFPIYRSLSDKNSGTTSSSNAPDYAEPIRHGVASKHHRPEMKTFLDLDALSTSSVTLSHLSSTQISNPHSSRPRLEGFNANIFLSSGRTSTATVTAAPEPAEATNLMATTSTDNAVRVVGADATTLHHSALRELRDLELMQDTDFALPDRGRQRSRVNSHHLRVFDHLSADDRPSSSRSHLRYWHRSKSPMPDASKYLRVSSDGSSPSISNLPSMTMTRDEFEALPPTIQRKYFSTVERIHIAQSPAPFPGTTSPADVCQASRLLGLEDTNCYGPSVLAQLSGHTAIGHGHIRVNSTERRFYANLPEKIKRRHLSREEQLVAQSRQHRRRSLSAGAADDFVKPKNRQSSRALDATYPSLGSTVSLIEELPTMQPQSVEQTCTNVKHDAPRETFFDSFRWLEDEDDLDLRLFLDDYHINLRDEVPLPSKSRRPSFRRHLSISKLPFGRTNISTTRLSTSSRGAVPTPTTAKPPSLISDVAGHTRQKSRALSLVNGNRQLMPASPTTAAAHYHDPEARLRLREYIGSSTKFDEALEFGFPSMEERPGKAGKGPLDLTLDFDKPRTFLDDDDKSSCSDEASVADPETPRTPQAFDKPSSEHLRTMTAFPISEPKADFLQAPLSSREMTLRMTLTRPDLRANEEQMYGWQKGSTTRPSHMRSGSKPPTVFVRDISPKDSIEKQFAAFDQENLAAHDHDNGVVRRFWKKVRRA